MAGMINNLKVFFAESNRLPEPALLGGGVAVLDIPFALPLAPGNFSLYHEKTQGFYHRELKRITLDWISHLGSRLVLWADHHAHTGWCAVEGDSRFYLDGGAPATAVLLTPDLWRGNGGLAQVDSLVLHADVDGFISAALFLMCGQLPYPAACADAVAADRRVGRMSPAGRLLDVALKYDGAESWRLTVLEWLLHGASTREPVITRAVQIVHGLHPASQRKINAEGRVVGGCRILDARFHDSGKDVTRLLLALQTGGRAGICLHPWEGREVASIAWKGCREGLPSLLGLPGGSPARVMLDASHLPEAVQHLNAHKRMERYSLPLPRRAMVEITRRCNLHCALCPIGTGIAPALPDMELSVFQAFLDFFAPGLDSLTLHNYGEPLLHPSLVEFIRLAKAARISRVDLSTNGNYLPQKLAEEIVASGLDFIRFSVDSTDPQVYPFYRAGGRLENVLAGMRRLVEARKTAGTHTPFIEAQALLTRQTEGNLQRFEQDMHNLGVDAVRWKTLNLYMSGVEIGANAASWLPQNHQLTRYQENHPKPARTDAEIMLCNWLWERVVVLADGTIVPCCHDFLGAYPLGQIQVHGSQNPWDTRRRRDFMVTRILHPAGLEMCTRCSSAVPALGQRRDGELNLPQGNEV